LILVKKPLVFGIFTTNYFHIKWKEATLAPA